MSSCSGKNIVVVLTGSIACYKAATLISRLVQAGAHVKTVTTRSALKFLGEATLEGLTGNKNHCNTFEAGEMMKHIHLARWADHIVVYPCTAHYLAQWAQGLAPDLASTLMLAKTPEVSVSFAPAMNPVMWEASITQKNLQQVIQSGAVLWAPEKGEMACGESGLGRLADPEGVFLQLQRGFEDQGSVLVTYGGTVEAIDRVRGITNFSTGNTGRRICEQLVRRGFSVTAVHGSRAPEAAGAHHNLVFSGFKSLHDLLKTQLKKMSYDSVIHLAAVSDFSVDKVVDAQGKSLNQQGKISSSDDLVIHMKKNLKILNQLKGWSTNKGIQVIGFKLTVDDSSAMVMQKVRALFSSRGVDFVVHNDLSSVREQHSYCIYNTDLKVVSAGQGKRALTEDLIQCIQYSSGNKKIINNEVTL